MFDAMLAIIGTIRGLGIISKSVLGVGDDLKASSWCRIFTIIAAPLWWVFWCIPSENLKTIKIILSLREAWTEGILKKFEFTSMTIVHKHCNHDVYNPVTHNRNVLCNNNRLNDFNVHLCWVFKVLVFIFFIYYWQGKFNHLASPAHCGPLCGHCVPHKLQEDNNRSIQPSSGRCFLGATDHFKPLRYHFLQIRQITGKLQLSYCYC